MERDIHEPPVTDGPDLGQTRDGLRVQHSVSNDAQAAVPLGDQHVVIGEERDCPGMRESFGDDADADRLLFCQIEHPGSVAEWRDRHACGRGLGMADA